MNLLRGGLPMVEQEPATTSWYGMRLGDSTFGIFDTFADDNGRQAHLAGRVAQALKQRGPDLFTRPPVIERIDVLARKLPRGAQVAHAAVDLRPFPDGDSVLT